MPKRSAGANRRSWNGCFRISMTFNSGYAEGLETREKMTMRGRATIIAALLAIGGIALLLGQQYSRQAQADEGWVTLFDGKNLDNWNQIGTADWKLAGGSVVADSGN